MATEQQAGASLNGRESLALTRTKLANERTMLAYARTAIMLAATGGTLLKLFGDSNSMVISGWGLVIAAIGVAWVGIARYRRQNRLLS